MICVLCVFCFVLNFFYLFFFSRSWYFFNTSIILYQCELTKCFIRILRSYYTINPMWEGSYFLLIRSRDFRAMDTELANIQLKKKITIWLKSNLWTAPNSILANIKILEWFFRPFTMVQIWNQIETKNNKYGSKVNFPYGSSVTSPMVLQ